MTSIDLRILPSTVPSLCIPRVFPNIDEKRIRKIFEELNMGEIERMDIVHFVTDKGQKFNRVFVHFAKWYFNENTNLARERILNGKEIKIIYDDPWFWKVSAYRPKDTSMNVEKRKNTPMKKAHISFDFDEDIKPKTFTEKPIPIHTNLPFRPRSLKPRTNYPLKEDKKSEEKERFQRPDREILSLKIPESPQYSPFTPTSSSPVTPRETETDKIQEEKVFENIYNEVLPPALSRRKNTKNPKNVKKLVLTDDL